MRVVIAEDNALLREGLVLLLTSSGHEVAAVAGSGPEVLPALLEHRPDVAVLDVRMPPGFRDEGLRAALEARREIPGLPVLVLSQYVEESYAAELLGGERAASAICSRTGSAGSTSSWTRSTGSRPAVPRSTRRWSPSCCPAARTHRSTRSPHASARC